MDNASLNKARAAKNDEFYTQLEDIECELKNYDLSCFEGKVIYCNCDSVDSNFVKYFIIHFERLSLKRLVATCYKTRQTDLFGERPVERATRFDYDGSVERITYLKGDGDFKSSECTKILRESDIAISNPPFSKFQSYLLFLSEHDKSFLVLGSQTAIARKNIFELFKNDKLNLGQTSGLLKFRLPDHYQTRDISYTEDEQGRKWKSLGNIVWYTNLPGPQRKFLACNTPYDPISDMHEKFDDYDAVNINRTENIPSLTSLKAAGCGDLKIAVPLTFMLLHNKFEFKLLGLDAHVSDNKHPGTGFSVNGKQTYARVIIQYVQRRNRD